MKKALYVVFLNPCVKSDDFSYLHRYFHLGSYKEGHAAFLCKEIDTSAPYFGVTLFGAGVLKNRKIQIQHSLVVSVLELVSLESQLGFVDSKKFIEELT